MSQTQLRTPGTGLPVTSVLVALDGSEFGEHAVAPAARLAAALGVPLLLWSAARTPAEAEDRRHRIAGQAERCQASWDVVVSDRPVEAISAAALAAGQPLVCLATHGRDRSAAVAPSVSMDLVGGLDRPVLLVGPNVKHPVAGHRLLACVDGSRDSEAVMAVAVAWAATLGLDVEAVTVAEPVPESVLRPGVYPRLHGPRGDADAYIADLATAWNGDVAVTGRAIYDPVDVAGALVDSAAAESSSLVVIGTKARRGLRRLVLGSKAAALTHQSPAPVLVAPV
jgi:nucleotide-binding universal stress UspA family protein